VTTTGRRREAMRVWRDVDGRVRCSCAEFSENDDLKFRCEHILAVKYYLEPPIDEVPAAELPEQATAAAAVETRVAPGTAPVAVYMAPESLDRILAPARSFDEMLVDLKRPLPDEVVKQRVGWTDRQGREHEVDYVEWHVVADILDAIAPRWSHAVRNIT